jgi:dTDP-4-amino-4,6-dideoxygalactose transaminase
MAIELTLQAMELGQDGRNEVITTPFTFASTTHAIVRNGLEPVFCDIDPETFTMDPRKLEEKITEKTCAVLPVHVYGNICDTEAIEGIARKYGLKVIYDACHTFGETVNGKGVGTFGDASCFSFHATKVYNTIEGGAVCFRDEKLGEKLYDLKNFGIHGPEEVRSVGANAKMNEFCAAMGLCNLRHVEEEDEKRRQADLRYRKHLEDVPGLQLNCIQSGVRHNHGYFPAVFEKDTFGADRNEVFEVLAKQNIHARKYFWPLTSAFGAFAGKYDPRKTPIALRVSENVLTLPMYADLEPEDIDRICEIVLGCRKT